MKLLYAVVLLFFVAYQVAEGFKLKTCKDADDCGKNRCCVRSTPVMPWIPEITKCKPMAKLGHKCNPDPDDDGVYQFTCPCREGMECVDVADSSSDSSSSSSEEAIYRCASTATSNPEEDVTTTEAESEEATGTPTEVVSEAIESEETGQPEAVPSANIV